MKAELTDQELVDRLMPPPDEEEIARLQAAGVRFPTGEPLPPFKPVKKRPRWLAFLVRVLRMDRAEDDDLREQELAMNPPAHEEEGREGVLPLHPDEIAALKAMGARFPSGGPVRDFEPVKLRPRWLAYVLRTIGRA